jgi:hypothetical protein
MCEWGNSADSLEDDLKCEPFTYLEFLIQPDHRWHGDFSWWSLFLLVQLMTKVTACSIIRRALISRRGNLFSDACTKQNKPGLKTRKDLMLIHSHPITSTFDCLFKNLPSPHLSFSPGGFYDWQDSRKSQYFKNEFSDLSENLKELLLSASSKRIPLNYPSHKCLNSVIVSCTRPDSSCPALLDHPDPDQ